MIKITFKTTINLVKHKIPQKIFFYKVQRSLSRIPRHRHRQFFLLESLGLVVSRVHASPIVTLISCINNTLCEYFFVMVSTSAAAMLVQYTNVDIRSFSFFSLKENSLLDTVQCTPAVCMQHRLKKYLHLAQVKCWSIMKLSWWCKMVLHIQSRIFSFQQASCFPNLSRVNAFIKFYFFVFTLMTRWLPPFAW